MLRRARTDMDDELSQLTENLFEVSVQYTADTSDTSTLLGIL